MTAEHVVLVRPSSSKRAELLKQEQEEQEMRSAEARNVLNYIRKLGLERESVPLGYATFKALAIEACPSWGARDVMDIFSTLDVARNGQICSHFLLQQLPTRFPERSLPELVQIAQFVSHYQEKQLAERAKQESPAASAEPAGSRCVIA